MAKYCIRCGTKSPDYANICGNCGAAFAAGASQNSVTDMSTLQNEGVTEDMVQPPVQNSTRQEEKTVKKMDFSVEKLYQTNLLADSKKIQEINCGKEFMFVLEEGLRVSTTEYKVQNSIYRSGLLRCKRVLYNGKVALFYCTECYRPLNILFPALNESRFLQIVENIMNKVMEIRENGFLSELGLDLRISKIYVDSLDGNVYLTYLPASERCYTDEWYLEEHLREDLSYMLRAISNSRSFYITNLTQMLEEPACSLSNILSAIRQNRSVSTGNG